MWKRIALALTFVGALAVAGLGMNSSAEAGCRYRGGGYYSGYGGFGGYGPHFGRFGHARRYTSFYHGYGGRRGFGGCHLPPRRHRGFHFSIGF